MKWFWELFFLGIFCFYLFIFQPLFLFFLTFFQSFAGYRGCFILSFGSYCSMVCMYVDIIRSIFFFFFFCAGYENHFHLVHIVQVFVYVLISFVQYIFFFFKLLGMGLVSFGSSCLTVIGTFNSYGYLYGLFFPLPSVKKKKKIQLQLRVLQSKIGHGNTILILFIASLASFIPVMHFSHHAHHSFRSLHFWQHAFRSLHC